MPIDDKPLEKIILKNRVVVLGVTADLIINRLRAVMPCKMNLNTSADNNIEKRFTVEKKEEKISCKYYNHHEYADGRSATSILYTQTTRARCGRKMNRHGR